MTARPHLLYLHGFLSSPQSQKAQQTIAFCNKMGWQDSYTVPEMPEGPEQTINSLCAWIDSNSDKDIVLMGSSLGGFYASYLAEKYALPAAIINPAVRPFELWRSHLGVHKNFYTDTLHEVTEIHVEELRKLYVKELSHPENYLVLVQTGDETLDYRQAVDKYRKSKCIVREGGNHSFENYIAELPAIFDFLLSRINPSAR